MPAIGHPVIADIFNYTVGCFCLPISYDNKIEYLVVISEIRENIFEIDRLVKLIERLASKDSMLVGSRKKADAYIAFMHKVVTGSITPEEIKSFEKNRGEGDHLTGMMMIFESDKYLQLFQKFKETVGLYSISESIKAELFLYENPVGNQAIVLWEIKTDESLNFYVYLKGI